MIFCKQKIAILSKDKETSKEVKKSISSKLKRTRVDEYEYPKKAQDLIDTNDFYDIILIDHDLGDINGAFMVKKLMVTSLVTAKTFIFSKNYYDEYNDFKFYISYNELIEHPDYILNVEGTSVDRAVESVCLSRINPGKKLAVV